MSVALINGRNFTHKDIVFNIGGVPIASLSNLDINDQTIREFSYGTGNLPVGYGDGRDEPVEVSFEISMTDFISLTRATTEGNIKRLDPFDIPVVFVNTSNPAGVTIKNVLIQGANPSTDTDTTDIKVPITAQASHLKWK